MRLGIIILIFLLSCYSTLWADQNVRNLKTIHVQDLHDLEVPLSRIHRASVVKKETLTKARVDHKNATSLARAVDLEPGVQTSITCANCGSSRVTLNGMRGENTTVLVDGIPAFSTVSSFYGMEAIPLAGLSKIEIMRGAGAALTAPEAIGGVINLVTERTDQKKFTYQARFGENRFFNQQLLGVYGNQQSGTMVAAQTNQMGFFDEDDNGVAESSAQKQRSAFLKHDHRLGDKLKTSFRAGGQFLELIGGVTDHYRSYSPPATLPDDLAYEGGDVRKKFKGTRDQIGDWIRLKRIDMGGSAFYHLNSDINLKASFAHAKQDQLSVYSHGYDYDNADTFRFYDLKLNAALNDTHLLTVGIDHKNEDMVSSSKTLYQDNNYLRDSFSFNTLGVYVQDEISLSDTDELHLVLRLDRLRVDWRDPRITQDELVKTAVAPRVHYKRQHSSDWTSRFSFGVGYRAPLTLFESQHGTNEGGFRTEIDEIEKAETYTYTLNHEGTQSSSAFSGTLTHLRHMAYGEEETSPTLFRNSRQSFLVSTLNLLHIQRLTSSWTLESSFDWFVMPDDYKEKLPIAAQETRARFLSDFHLDDTLEFVTILNVIGPRNLRPYRYEKNYNVATYTDPPIDGLVPSKRKDQNAPLYATIDLFVQRKLTQNLEGQIGVNNLLDYTQTSQGDSPLSWRMHIDHLHQDNRHVWGPLQGRVIYGGLKYNL